MIKRYATPHRLAFRIELVVVVVALMTLGGVTVLHLRNDSSKQATFVTSQGWTGAYLTFSKGDAPNPPGAITSCPSGTPPYNRGTACTFVGEISGNDEYFHAPPGTYHLVPNGCAVDWDEGTFQITQGWHVDLSDPISEPADWSENNAVQCLS